MKPSSSVEDMAASEVVSASPGSSKLGNSVAVLAGIGRYEDWERVDVGRVAVALAPAAPIRWRKSKLSTSPAKYLCQSAGKIPMSVSGNGVTRLAHDEYTGWV